MALLLLVQYRTRLIASLDRERQAAERLRELDLLRRTLLAAASHDLRTPTTAIVGAARLLETVEVGKDDARTLATLISRAGDRLTQLLDDLLDIEEIQRGDLRLHLAPEDLSSIVRGELEALDLPSMPRLVVDLHPVTVPLDGGKVARVVENLLVNAFRHAEGATTVWVQVRATDGGAELTVQDDGAGVGPDDREAIFAPFRRGATEASGSGLGLSIVAGFVGLHGGRAWVDERPGGGASFHASFPAHPVRDQAPGSQAGETSSRGVAATA
jgi:signal transduction histidine kinase